MTPLEPDTSSGGGILRRLDNLEAGQKAQTAEIVEMRKQLTKLEPIPGLLRWAIGLLVPGAIGFAVSVVLLIPK